MTVRRNVYGWYLSFEAHGTWKNAVAAAEEAITVCKVDQAAGVKRYLVSDPWGNMEFLLWTMYLQEAGIDVHFAASDERTGHEEVYINVYNEAADLVGFPITHPCYDFGNWKSKSEAPDYYPELVAQRERLTLKYDQLRAADKK